MHADFHTWTVVFFFVVSSSGLSIRIIVSFLSVWWNSLRKVLVLYLPKKFDRTGRLAQWICLVAGNLSLGPTHMAEGNNDSWKFSDLHMYTDICVHAQIYNQSM